MIGPRDFLTIGQADTLFMKTDNYASGGANVNPIQGIINSDDRIEELCIDGSFAFIEFSSSLLALGISSQGIQIDYEAQGSECASPALPVMDAACTLPVQLTDSWGSFRAHNRDMSRYYLANQKCRWSIDVKVANSIRITFSSFELDDVDFILVGPDADSLMMRKFTGSSSNDLEEICVSGNRADVVFISTEGDHREQGFIASYSASSDQCPTLFPEETSPATIPATPQKKESGVEQPNGDIILMTIMASLLIVAAIAVVAMMLLKWKKVMKSSKVDIVVETRTPLASPHILFADMSNVGSEGDLILRGAVV